MPTARSNGCRSGLRKTSSASRASRGRPTLREALRSLALANNGFPLEAAAREAFNRAAERASLRLDHDGELRAHGRGDALDGVVAVVSRRDDRRHVGAAQGVPQLQLVVLRLLAEPVGDVVLDAALRQPLEDARVPPPTSRITSRRCALGPRRGDLHWRSRRASTWQTSAQSPTPSPRVRRRARRRRALHDRRSS